MRREFRATIVQEGDLWVAQCLDVDVASQGATAEEARDNLSEALALYFTPPLATAAPQVITLPVDIADAA